MNPEQGYKHSEETKNSDVTPLRTGVLGDRLSSGSHADVYNLNSQGDSSAAPMVAKIGNTEKYAAPLMRGLNFGVPRELLSRILVKTLGPQFQIFPDEDFIRRGVGEYLLMKQYLSNEPETKDREGDELNDQRKELAESLQNPSDQFYQEIIKVLGDPKQVKELAEVIKRQENANFLPKERTVIGHPPSLTRERAKEMMAKGEILPSTYYIFQDKVEGEAVVPLMELTDEELRMHPALVEKLLAFAVLIKKMYSDTGKMIDMRPDEVAKHPLEWFQQTANALVDKSTDELFFVDTRWLWHKDSRIGEKGVNLIGFLGVRSIDRAIRKYKRLLDELSGDRNQQ